jgi:hypothetical protein
VEGNELPMMKPNFISPLVKNLEVGMEVKGMGVCTLGIIMDGLYDTNGIPTWRNQKQKV